MVTIEGFFSYTHADDHDDKGRIRNLAEDIKAEYSMITGEDIKLFFDKEDLEWGGDWRSAIDKAITAGKLFIPILTPRFFSSPQCLRELELFVQQAESLGVKELILPILYVPVEQLDNEQPSDEIVALMKAVERVDWCELRWKPRNSEKYRRAVNGLVQRIRSINRQVEETDLSPPSPKATTSEAPEPDDEKLGFLDQIAVTQATMPEWTGTLNGLADQMNVVNDKFTKGTKDIKRNDVVRGGIAGRIKIFKQLAKELGDPAVTIEQLGRAYLNQLREMDGGMHYFIEQVPLLRKRKKTAEQAGEFVTNVTTLVASARAFAPALQGMRDNMTPIEAASKDLRRPLRTIRRGLINIEEGYQIIDGWMDHIEKLKA